LEKKRLAEVSKMVVLIYTKVLHRLERFQRKFEGKIALRRVLDGISPLCRYILLVGFLELNLPFKKAQNFIDINQLTPLKMSNIMDDDEERDIRATGAGASPSPSPTQTPMVSSPASSASSSSNTTAMSSNLQVVEASTRKMLSRSHEHNVRRTGGDRSSSSPSSAATGLNRLRTAGHLPTAGSSSPSSASSSPSSSSTSSTLGHRKRSVSTPQAITFISVSSSEWIDPDYYAAEQHTPDSYSSSKISSSSSLISDYLDRSVYASTEATRKLKFSSVPLPRWDEFHKTATAGFLFFPLILISSS